MVSLMVATVLGFLSGLGIGGGSLLMLYLTMIMQIPFSEAKELNLLFFLPCSLCASIFRIRNKRLSLSSLLPAIGAGVVSAISFSALAGYLPETVLKKIFGFLLLLTAYRELTYRPRNPR